MAFKSADASQSLHRGSICVIGEGERNPDEDTFFWDMLLCPLVRRYYLSNLAFLI
jgi:hypothetical protein